jgi:hypothetical protein
MKVKIEETVVPAKKNRKNQYVIQWTWKKKRESKTVHCRGGNISRIVEILTDLKIDKDTKVVIL